MLLKPRPNLPVVANFSSLDPCPMRAKLLKSASVNIASLQTMSDGPCRGAILLSIKDTVLGGEKEKEKETMNKRRYHRKSKDKNRKQTTREIDTQMKRRKQYKGYILLVRVFIQHNLDFCRSCVIRILDQLAKYRISVRIQVQNGFQSVSDGF